MHMKQLAERPKVSMIPISISQDDDRWQITLFEAVNGDTYAKKSKHGADGYQAEWYQVKDLGTVKSGDPKLD